MFCDKVERLSVFRDLDLSECKSMYEPSHIGALHIKNALNPWFHDLLRVEILGVRDRLKKGIERVGPVTQNVFSANMEHPPKIKSASELTLVELPYSTALTKAYTDYIYNPIARMGGFSEIDMVNSVGINMYPKKVGGISSHRDLDRDKNLNGIISIEGVGLISFPRTRNGMAVCTFVMHPTDLTLIRANLERGENKAKFQMLRDVKTLNCALAPEDKRNIGGGFDLGPFHKVETLDQDRYSIVLRNCVE
jgi:hypothetical protein